MKQLINRLIFSFSFLLPLAPCSAQVTVAYNHTACQKNYKNPVFEPDLADPTVVKAPDGYFYAYGTENTWSSGVHRVTPIARSMDLVNWVYVGDAFAKKPDWKQAGGIWAPCIVYRNNTYYLYYSFSTWGDSNPGIGLASSPNPGGPFTDQGKVFDSVSIGVANSIDPFFITVGEGRGQRHYLFWGSFRGVYGIEVADDMKTLIGKKFQIAGDAFEAVYIYPINGKFYFFGSNGSCCEGKDSKYRVSVAVADDIKGPYKRKDGASILNDGTEGTLFLKGDANTGWVGPGHNGEIFTDESGRDFVLYHAIDYSNPLLPNGATRRPLMLDQVHWDEDGWPYIENAIPGSSYKAAPHITTKKGQTKETEAHSGNTGNKLPIELADPTVFYDNGLYYLYGTGGDVNKGFLVYTSTDLEHWEGPKGSNGGYALTRGDTYGTQGFWAPQIFRHKDKIHMAYTANEQVAIATSDSPLGPFKQTELKKISGAERQIDPYVFFDDDGKIYLYHVRLEDGNKLYVAEMNDDLSDIKAGTARLCIEAKPNTWEDTKNAAWRVSEGPTILKHNGLCYFFYSANDFRNIDYAVGYATSTSPLGPWERSADNPIISRNTIGHNGSGHGDLFQDANGNWHYVFHVHVSDSVVSPRQTAIVSVHFSDDTRGLKIDKDSFRLLRK